MRLESRLTALMAFFVFTVVVLVVVVTSSEKVETITEQVCNDVLTNTYRSMYINNNLRLANITNEEAWSWQQAEAMLQSKLCPGTTSKCKGIASLRETMAKNYGDNWECQCNDDFTKTCVTNNLHAYCQHHVCRQSKTENEVWPIVVAVLAFVIVFAAILWCWAVSPESSSEEVASQSRTQLQAPAHAWPVQPYPYGVAAP